MTAGSFTGNEQEPVVLGRPSLSHPSTTGPPGGAGEPDGGGNHDGSPEWLTPAAAATSHSANLWDRSRELDRRIVGRMWDADGRPSWIFYLVVVAFNIQSVVSRALRGGSFWAGVQTGFFLCGDLFLVAMAVQAKRRSSG